MESNTTKPNRRTEEEWVQLIQECRTSGLSDKEWCRQNNVVNDFMSCHQTAHTNCHQIA